MGTKVSIRWLFLASQATGISKAKNLLRSEDVLSAIECLKKLGIKIKLTNKDCTVFGRGINGTSLKYYFKYWKFWNGWKTNIATFD